MVSPIKPAYSFIGQWFNLCTFVFSSTILPYVTLSFLLAAEVATMHVKITPNNQVTPPDEIASQVEVAKCPDAEVNNAVTPALVQSAEAVRDKLIASGISEKDVADASAWARRPKE
jgi:hypothetical protein